jgi:hypothetical protein
MTTDQPFARKVMTLRSHSLFLLSRMACIGLFVVGCDSVGNGGNGNPTTIKVTLNPNDGTF